jgi:hypothetical protein
VGRGYEGPEADLSNLDIPIPLKVVRRFVATCRLHFQGRILRQIRSQDRSFSLILYGLLAGYLIEYTPLWSSGRTSWLYIQSSEFDSRRYQIF